ncbi:hypothetical protein J7E97_26300 [Streptomyces sp. ISL-66]|uniref:hypothetical protein n=1 Tax=Streptomyces sp. ISL-66 TaxID=2819186 RepID=UPI001BE8E90C|nr:hypothetical protein [Streptomyces sp. ISL-66]MBT2471275.1 hypothetical protein [Streptomyces sp. ISL-66]
MTHQLDRLQEVFDLIAGQEKAQGGRPPLSRGEAAPYRRLTVQPSDPVLWMALEVLSEDFRNPSHPPRSWSSRSCSTPPRRLRQAY